MGKWTEWLCFSAATPSVLLEGTSIAWRVSPISQWPDVPWGQCLCCTLSCSGVLGEHLKRGPPIVDHCRRDHLSFGNLSKPHRKWGCVYVCPVGGVGVPPWSRKCEKATPTTPAPPSQPPVFYFKSSRVAWSDVCPSPPLLVYWNIGSWQCSWNAISGRFSKAEAGPTRRHIFALFFFPSHWVFLEVLSQAQCGSPQMHSKFPAACYSARPIASPFKCRCPERVEMNKPGQRAIRDSWCVGYRPLSLMVQLASSLKKQRGK